MIKISSITPKQIGGGINLIDLGSSGDVPKYWNSIAHLINLFGFDPNKEECLRLSSKKSGFLSQQFFPYAISGESKSFELYKTKDIFCWSLLKPNLSWLRRFTYSDLFEIESKEIISAFTLADVPELKGIEIDAIKLDTQGLELPILKSSESLLEQCILIETETGFTENYLGETTFDQIASYLRSQGFGLFDINVNHRVARKNSFADKTKNEQILWCEAVWLRDYRKIVSTEKPKLTREKGLKALCIYANHGCYSFGLEMAEYFYDLGILTPEEYRELSTNIELWKFITKSRFDTQLYRFQNINVPGTYLFVGETERQDVLKKYPNFQEEGPAFKVGKSPEINTISVNRFQSTVIPGTYTFATETDFQQNYNTNQFVNEGIAFYAYDPSSDFGTQIYRFENRDRLGTFLFVGPEERQNILSNYPIFEDKGVVFRVET